MNHEMSKRVLRIKKQIQEALLLSEVELSLINGTVFNVFNGEFEQVDLGINDGIIVSIGKNIPAKTVVDVSGKYIIPGLIDAHTHIESTLLTPTSLDEALLLAGTTTIIADPHEIANVSGIDGIQFMLDEASKTITDMYFMIPSCVPAAQIDPSHQTLSADVLEKFLHHPRVLGLGEVMDEFGVIHQDESLIEKLALFEDQIIDGHAPTLDFQQLKGYRSAKILTDHECSTRKQLQQRVQLGMYVAIREGSASKNLEELLSGVTPMNYHRCMFCTDDIHPQDILNRGHVLAVVKKAVSLGLNPVYALKMATINPATCYQLTHLGALSLGYQADAVIIDNLHDFTPLMTIKKGQLIQKAGQSRNPEATFHQKTIVSPKISVEDLKDLRDGKTTRVISMQKDSLLTTSKVVPTLTKDLVKCVIINRYSPTLHHFIGYVEHTHMHQGAIASSVSHDAHHILAIGIQDEDIVCAVNDLIDHQGGFVLANQRKVLEALYLPIGGLMSHQSIEIVAQGMEKLQKSANDQFGFDHSILALTFLGLPVIGDVKMNVNGYIEVATQTILQKDN